MNKLSIGGIIGGLVIIGGLAITPVMAAEDVEKTPEQQCQEYAVEDGVAAEQMETYVAECVASLSESETSVAEEGNESGEKTE